LCDFA
jgi:hypothetical protein